MKFLHKIYAGNSLEQWLISIGAAILVYVVFTWALRFVTKRLARMATHTDTKIDDMFVDLLRGTRWYVILAWCTVIAVQGLKVPPAVVQFGLPVLVALSLLQLGLWGNHVIAYWIGHAMKSRDSGDPASATTMTAVRFASKLILWSVLALVALDNLGVDVTALVAGLGIGGIAVALALQTILGDALASLSIVLDKPFQLGDFIVVGEYKGTVEHIGIKTTRIRSLSGEQLIFANADLLGSRIRNYKRMSERRVVFTIGVTYQTSTDKLKKIPGIIRESIEAQKKTRFDRSHFASFGDSAMNIETVYYVLSDDYTLYMDIQQEVNLQINDRFKKARISFAYPTRTVYTVKQGVNGS